MWLVVAPYVRAAGPTHGIATYIPATGVAAPGVLIPLLAAAAVAAADAFVPMGSSSGSSSTSRRRRRGEREEAKGLRWKPPPDSPRTTDGAAAAARPSLLVLDGFDSTDTGSCSWRGCRLYMQCSGWVVCCCWPPSNACCEPGRVVVLSLNSTRRSSSKAHRRWPPHAHTPAFEWDASNEGIDQSWTDLALKSIDRSMESNRPGR